MEVALVDLGLMPDDFWNLTFVEFNLLCKGHFRKQDIAWTHTRFLAHIPVNIHRKPNSPYIQPQDLLPLAIDPKPEPQIAPSVEHIEALEKKFGGYTPIQ